MLPSSSTNDQDVQLSVGHSVAEQVAVATAPSETYLRRIAEILRTRAKYGSCLIRTGYADINKKN